MSLKVDNLSFQYGDRPVLRRVGFTEEFGQFVAVMGRNGSGKTTLLKNINRLLKPAGGSVFIDGNVVESMTRSDIARHFGYVPQRSDAVHCTVLEAVLLGRKMRGAGSEKEDLEKVQDLLKLLRIDHLAMRMTTQLSGGELQKVVIARALAQEPRALLLDEPINHLDPINQIEVMSLLRAVTHDLNIVSMLVTHDLNSALRFADRFIMLKDGSVYAEGREDVITTDSVKAVFGIDIVVQKIMGVPIVVPVMNEVREHRHLHVHEHGHGDHRHEHGHEHYHSHQVDYHVYDHEHTTLHKGDENHHSD